MSTFNICVIYKAKKLGDRELFVSELKNSGVLDLIKNEDGCLCYEYFYSDEEKTKLVLFEKWESSEHQKIHMTMPHMKTAFEIKNKYIESAEIKQIEIK